MFEKVQRFTMIFTLLVLGILILYVVWELTWELRIGTIHLGFIILVITALFLFVGSLFYLVINAIPRTIAQKFDLIKNKIARKEITEIPSFCQELNTFLTTFFNYISFDISYAATKIKNHNMVYSTGIKDPSELERLHDINENTIKENTTLPLGTFRLNHEKVFGYLIPIFFGHEYLGYFIVFSRSRLNKIYLDFLHRFEDDFIDDQLVHVLQFK